MHQKFLNDVLDMIITSLVDSKTTKGEKSIHSTDIVSNGWHTSACHFSVIHTDMVSIFCFEKKPRGFNKHEIRVSLTVLLLYNSLETSVYTEDYSTM